MAFKTIVKMKTGGSVAKAAEYTKRDRKEVGSEDIAQDKKIVKKAIGMHDKQQHEAPTDLSKLKKGGRAKKEVGTVKKYCGGKGVKKYADGGSVLETIKNAGKKLYENVMGTPEQNAAAKANLDKVAEQPGAMGATERAIRTVAKKRGGKC